MLAPMRQELEKMENSIKAVLDQDTNVKPEMDDTPK